MVPNIWSCILGVLCASLLWGSEQNTERRRGTIVVQYVGNYDGDTITVNLEDLKLSGLAPEYELFGKGLLVRLRGIDTPEIRSKCPAETRLAKEARDFLKQYLYNAERVVLKNISRGKYFRLVADVYADGRSLNKLLLKAGYAKRYVLPGKKPVWCDKRENIIY